MKTCFVCAVAKPLTAFYAAPGMRDGRAGKCKECAKSAARAHRDANIDAARAYDLARAKLPERKAMVRRTTLKRIAARPERERARYATSNAIRDGRLTPKPCEECRAEPAQAHHDDYSRPLDVRWLCRRCHWNHHRQNPL